MKQSIKSLVLEMNYNKDLRCNEPRISNNDLLEEKIFLILEHRQYELSLYKYVNIIFIKKYII